MKKIAVFYYTQSGQALNAARNICSALEKDEAWSVIYKEIVPERQYPFPWSKTEFFDVFPETRLGMPCSGIKTMDFTDIEDADLVMVVGQSWFLSPSMPLQSFFTDSGVKSFLCGRNVVFVNVCRNMWLMTSRKIKRYIADAGASLVGHIVLQDETSNLISVLTIVRWLINGKKESSTFLPAAGVQKPEMEHAEVFGSIIRDCVDVGTLQSHLLQNGAIHYKPSVLYLEKAGHRMFGLWAHFIRQKGEPGNPHRHFRDVMFYYYLIGVLFLISPFAQLVFYLTYPLHRVGKAKRQDCNI